MLQLYYWMFVHLFYSDVVVLVSDGVHHTLFCYGFQLTCAFPDKRTRLDPEINWLLTEHITVLNNSFTRLWCARFIRSPNCQVPCGRHSVIPALARLCDTWDKVDSSIFIIPPASTRLIRGYTGITLSVCPSARPSVCPSVDRIVSALYLQEYSSDPFHICTSNFGDFFKFVTLTLSSFDLGSNMTQWYG